ncbi:MAG: hypothetical protein AAFR76_02375 [Planctomycetota bacterium]
MKTQTKMLFGGALLAAGMHVDASAQQFQLSGTQSIFGYADTLVEVSGYDYYSVGYFGTRSVDGGFGDSYSYSFVNASGSASITTTQFSAEAYSNGYLGYLDSSLTARAFGAVTVDRDATLELAWDFSDQGFDVNGTLQIVDESAGGVVLFRAPNASAGTASVQLLAGTNYQIFARADVGSDWPDDLGTPPPFAAFATATLIPAPASAALLGLSGLAAARRRR